MCGIAGGIHNNISRKQMDVMLEKIAHRGPDDQGIFVHEDCWLGNTRLAIQDLSHDGHQPMQSADGRYTIVYNGELYNHHELRHELIALGVVFHSSSDTETLLYAYVHFGKKSIEKLNGIFAFAIHDKEAHTVFIARDPLGVKPLYYYQDEHHFLFASELKALTGIDALDYSLNQQAIATYLQLLYCPGTATPFSKISKLLPGHYLEYSNGKMGEQTRYYQIPFNGNYDERKSRKEWIEQVDACLHKAVSSQLISDAPIGYFLSGGLDSSLVAALAAKKHHQAPLTCFTINTGDGMQQEGFEDDITYARLAAQHIGANLIEVDGALNIEREFDELIYHLDEPQADPAAFFVWKIAKAAQQKGIKVLLGGTGADDVFSGYRRHQALRYEKWVAAYPSLLHKPTKRVLNAVGNKNLERRLSKILRKQKHPLHHRIDHFFWLDHTTVNGLFKAPNTIPNPHQYFEKLLTEIPEETSPLNQMLYWEMRTFLPDHNLNYTDKMSMAAGVETRVPFLDTEIIALSTKLPPKLKMKGTKTKYILRQVARKYLPQEIIERKKTGFGAPLRTLINGELSGMVRQRLLSGSLERWNIFNVKAIAQLIEDNAHGEVDAAYSIFALMAIESWLRQFAAK